MSKAKGLPFEEASSPSLEVIGQKQMTARHSCHGWRRCEDFAVGVRGRRRLGGPAQPFSHVSSACPLDGLGSVAF